MFSSVSASEAAELVNLLLMVLLVPVTLVVMRGLKHPGRLWILAGFLTIAGVRTFGLVERYWLGNPVLPVKQFATAFAGVAFAIGLWQLALVLRRREVL